MANENGLNTISMWNLLGKAISVLMLPWMIWVSLSLMTVMKDVAVFASNMEELPNEVRQLRDRIIRLETRVELLGEE